MTTSSKTLAMFGVAAVLLLAGLVVPSMRPHAWVAPAHAAAPAVPRPALKPIDGALLGDRIQIALLLDTSSSMSGLIDQAKSQLWTMVNELASARRDGRAPRLELALYEYGNSNLSQAWGYIRQVSGFTSDLDRVSEQLFALTTDGGDEFCGLVIQRAVQQLEWSSSKDDLKLVFIAGNEPFNQGPVAPAKAIAEAAAKGIVVNTVHCGGGSEAEGWRDGALLARGTAMVIDHNARVAHVAAPQDDEIARLGQEINKTYLPYGAQGAASARRQAAQDGNAREYSFGSLLQRSVSKSSNAYSNSGWDLVDAVKDNRVRVGEVADADLPAEMRGMSAAERKAHVEAKLQERAQIQKRIADLNVERTRYVSGQAKAEAGRPQTLDLAMVESVRQQASKSGYRFE